MKQTLAISLTGRYTSNEENRRGAKTVTIGQRQGFHLIGITYRL
jgi:hypothetical protein